MKEKEKQRLPKQMHQLFLGGSICATASNSTAASHTKNKSPDDLIGQVSRVVANSADSKTAEVGGEGMLVLEDASPVHRSQISNDGDHVFYSGLESVRHIHRLLGGGILTVSFLM
jgi:hypothetical protein